MLSYLRIYNYLAEEKIEIEYPAIVENTLEFKKTQEILEAVQAKDVRVFYELFTNSDYVYSCALVPLVHALR